MLRITITFSYGGVQTIDCDKMMRSLRYKSEVMGMFREKDKPKDPQRRWQPFYTVNMAHVASLYRIELPDEAK